MSDFTAFLDRHKLPTSYAELIEQRFKPVAAIIAQQRKALDRPLLVGINGCQGSGKTTLADALVMLLENVHQLRSAAISIDDFYLTKAEREQLGRDVHPLLKTRGVPGTHDMSLADKTLASLISDDQPSAAIPRFNKAIDDRQPEAHWDHINTPLDVLILEGWCVGATPQTPGELLDPINTLEEKEDSDSSWRRYVNESLEKDYQPLYNKLDILVMLKAPSFDTVFRWRMEQEEKLRTAKQQAGEDTSGIMSAEQIQRFIQHYQRITEHSLRYMPQRANFLFELDGQRQIVSQSMPRKLPQ